MSARLASRWQAALLGVVAGLAAVAPLAVFLRAYDPGALRELVFELAALCAAFAWALKSLERGRFELPDALVPLLAPAAALALWSGLRCALDSSPLPGLPFAVAAALGFLLFACSALELGGLDVVSKLSSAALAAAWAAALYGLLQRLGLEPSWLLAWRGGGPGEAVGSTFLRPGLFGAFLALCVPLIFFKRLDEERDPWLKRLDLLLLALCAACAAWTRSSEALASFVVLCLATAALLAAMIPSRAARREALLALLAAAGALAAATALEGPALFADASFMLQYKRLMWPAAARAALAKPFAGQGYAALPGALASRAPVAALALTGAHGALLTPSSGLLELTARLGLLGALLWLWVLAALWRTVWRARRAFARSASVGELHALACLCAAVFGLAAAGALVGQASPADFAWLFWPLAGCLAGLTQLAPASRVVRVLPMTLTPSGRRGVYAAAALAFVGLSVMPVRWLGGEVALNQAQALARAGDWEGAQEKLSAVPAGSPDYVAAQYMLGGALLAAGKPQEARFQLERVADLSPDYALTDYLAAQACARSGAWACALAQARRQRELDPLLVDNEGVLADAAKTAGRFDEARRAALTAIALEPKDPVHWLALSEIYARERKLGAAARVRRTARRLQRQNRAGGGRPRPVLPPEG